MTDHRYVHPGKLEYLLSLHARSQAGEELTRDESNELEFAGDVYGAGWTEWKVWRMKKMRAERRRAGLSV